MAIWGDEGTQDIHIIFLQRFLLYLSRAPAPSSSPIHGKPLCNLVRAARLSVSRSWQTSLHSLSQNTGESVLGKWQGRRPLPAWSLDQGLLYPAIYPLWTGWGGGGVGGGRRKDEADDRRNEAVNQTSAKTKKDRQGNAAGQTWQQRWRLYQSHASPPRPSPVFLLIKLMCCRNKRSDLTIRTPIRPPSGKQWVPNQCDPKSCSTGPGYWKRRSSLFVPAAKNGD